MSHLEFAATAHASDPHTSDAHTSDARESFRHESDPREFTANASVADEFTYETNVFVGMADLFSTTDVNVRAPEDSDNPTGTSPTADLLEALRRRRGEKEKTPAWLQDGPTEKLTSQTDTSSQPSAPQPFFPQDPTTSPVSAKAENRTGSHAKRERTSMPSWDEIVFGTRAEEDPQ